MYNDARCMLSLLVYDWWKTDVISRRKCYKKWYFDH